MYVNHNNLPGLILSLDQTYDRVEWDFLFKVLEKLNFGPNFIKIIKTCYNNIQSAIKINGFVSSSFFTYLGELDRCARSAQYFTHYWLKLWQKLFGRIKKLKE